MEIWYICQVKDGIVDIAGSCPEKGLLVKALSVEGRGHRSRSEKSQMIMPVNEKFWKCMKEVVEDEHCLMDGWRKRQNSSLGSPLGESKACWILTWVPNVALMNVLF